MLFVLLINKVASLTEPDIVYEIFLGRGKVSGRGNCWRLKGRNRADALVRSFHSHHGQAANKKYYSFDRSGHPIVPARVDSRDSRETERPDDPGDERLSLSLRYS